MPDDIAIKVDNVSKEFKLPHEKVGSIKGMFVNMFRGKRTFERQKVLKNVSLEIKKGEFFGIVGRNGSGKSTLLKLLAGIYEPNEGAITINGKLTPFIELGVGFNPDLTGRENVYLNGALLGFTRQEMTDMYDEIVEFAELERFMDQKLNNYSSGMQVRLAFSIAIRARSDILLLDEVLAVGDEAFQKKCISYFHDLKRSNQTVILVTHDMSTIRQYCDRAAVIDSSELVFIGNPNEAAQIYSEKNISSKHSHKSEEGDGSVEILRAETIKARKKVNKFKPNEQICVNIVFTANKKITNPIVGLVLSHENKGLICATNTKIQGEKIPSLNKGEVLNVSFEFENILTDGDYSVSCAVNSWDQLDIYAKVDNIHAFSVYGRHFPQAACHPNFNLNQYKD